LRGLKQFPKQNVKSRSEGGRGWGWTSQLLCPQVALADRTPWELVTALLDQGWTWQPLPERVVARLALPWFNLRDQSPKVLHWERAEPRVLTSAVGPGASLGEGFGNYPARTTAHLTVLGPTLAFLDWQGGAEGCGMCSLFGRSNYQKFLRDSNCIVFCY